MRAASRVVAAITIFCSASFTLETGLFKRITVARKVNSCVFADCALSPIIIVAVLPSSSFFSTFAIVSATFSLNDQSILHSLNLFSSSSVAVAVNLSPFCAFAISALSLPVI